MDFDRIPLVALAKRNLAWLGQRQEVLAHNVANADTPGYRARDLKPLSFRGMVPERPGPVALATTASGHLAGPRRHAGAAATVEQRRPFETAPDGNSVVLEQQMAKVSETALSYRLANELYRKQLGMFRIAIGQNR
ncbi:MAG: flagellar basal body rod protein FlgB [Rhodospirillales bacterium]|nr:MAG: flagellar basal body rod protein FlgB [Rhodospirillales bacterium]